MSELILDISCKNLVRTIELTEPMLLMEQNCKIYNNYDTSDL